MRAHAGSDRIDLLIPKELDIPFVDSLFMDVSIRKDLRKQGEKLYKKGEMTREQLWLGSYYKKEIEFALTPPVEIRYIDETLGRGVFALRDFRPREFIAQYSGVLRKRKKEDSKNSYCFEYVLASGHPTPYIIDARDQGGISRYINHSSNPNLTPALATIDFITHVIFYVQKPIAKGEQLTYDYGPDYWAHRAAPV